MQRGNAGARKRIRDFVSDLEQALLVSWVRITETWFSVFGSCGPPQYSTVQYNTMQYNAVHTLSRPGRPSMNGPSSSTRNEMTRNRRTWIVTTLSPGRALLTSHFCVCEREREGGLIFSQLRSYFNANDIPVSSWLVCDGLIIIALILL